VVGGQRTVYGPRSSGHRSLKMVRRNPYGITTMSQVLAIL